VEGAPPEQNSRWQASFDLQDVPAGENVDLFVDAHSPGAYLQRGEGSSAMSFIIYAETGELTVWVLMPEGRQYQGFRIVRFETGKPEKAEAVKVVTEYLAEDHTILAFKLLSLKPGHTYELLWSYK
jgi:hypothetical protein